MGGRVDRSRLIEEERSGLKSEYVREKGREERGKRGRVRKRVCKRERTENK